MSRRLQRRRDARNPFEPSEREAAAYAAMDAAYERLLAEATTDAGPVVDRSRSVCDRWWSEDPR